MPQSGPNDPDNLTKSNPQSIQFPTHPKKELPYFITMQPPPRSRPNPKQKPPKPSPFILKLAEILNTPAHSSYISWTPLGRTFTVHQPYEFSRLLLPQHFRHANYGSFLRQLNLYNFSKHKAVSDQHQFCHPMFRRDNQQEYHLIKRAKIQSSRNSTSNDAENNNNDEQNQVQTSKFPELQSLQQIVVSPPPLEQQITDLSHRQKDLLTRCRQVVDQGKQTLEWGFIRTAELEDDRTSQHLLSHKISAFLEAHPEMADHLAYFDSQTIRKLIRLLQADYSASFPKRYRESIDAFFRLVDSSEMPMVVAALGVGYEKSMSKKGKNKNRNYTIVGREGKLPASQRAGEQ